MRGLLAAFAAAVHGAAVFIGASQAMSAQTHASADFPSNLPVSKLPVVALSSDDETQFSNLLGSDTAAEIGITNRSWDLAYYGGNYSSASGIGTIGHIWSSNGYATAACWFLGNSVSGYCVTYWHD